MQQPILESSRENELNSQAPIDENEDCGGESAAAAATDSGVFESPPSYINEFRRSNQGCLCVRTFFLFYLVLIR